MVVRIRVVLLLGWPHAEQLWMLASQTNSYCIKYDHPSPQRNTEQPAAIFAAAVKLYNEKNWTHAFLKYTIYQLSEIFLYKIPES